MSKVFIKTLSAVAVSAILVGCGGGGGTPPSSNPTTESNNYTKNVKVADGYIAGADVLVDINTTTSGFPADSTGDYTGKTDSNGDFKIPSDLNLKVGTFIYAKGGHVVSTGKAFEGILKSVYSGSGKEIVITPLTTMVAKAAGSNPTKAAIEEAKTKVAKALGVPKDSVAADPVKDKEAFKATQTVVAIAKVVKETHTEDKNVTDILEEVADHIKNDANLTAAIEQVAPDENASQAAQETAQKVQETIEKLNEHGVDESATLEDIITKEVVDKAAQAAKNDENVTAVLESVDVDNFADVAKAAACLTFEKIKGSNSVSNAVTADLNLTAKSSCEDNNVTIAWVNHSSNIDLTTGAITQETYEDKIAFVEANITKGTKALTKPIYMTIKAKGHKPVAKDDMAQTSEDTNVTIDVLANDSDADGNSELNITSITKPAHGEAHLNNGKIDYSPYSNFNGVDSFVYTLTDPLGAEVNATVHVVVADVNDAPVLSDIADHTIKEDVPNPLQIQLNATDADDDNLTMSVSVDDNSKVTAEINGDTLTITPKPNMNGAVTITVTVSDGKGGTVSKTFTLNITPVNDAPVAVDDDLPAISSNASAILDVLKNDTDVDGDTLTITNISTPNSGSAVVENGKIKYTPVADFNGTVTFTYTISDGNATDTATVTFDIAQYVTKIREAIDKVNAFDTENGDFNTLLDDLKNTLNIAPSSEKDAQVGLALVELAETLDSELGNLLTVDGVDATLVNLLSRDDSAKVALAAIDSLGEQTESSLSKIADKLKAVAGRIDTLLASDPNYEFKYKDITLSRDDLKALSGALDLKAALLEYMAAYNPAKIDYLKTKKETINGKEVEYRVIKADPKTVLNDPTTLSLNSNAQTHLNNSKDELQKAINKLASVNVGDVNSKFRSKIDELQGKLTDINASLNGNANYVIEKGSEKYYIDIAALFSESSALTLSTTIGNNVEYRSHYCDADYNATMSKFMNRAMGTCKDDYVTFSDGSKGYISTKMTFKPRSIPMGDSNHLTKVLTKINKDGKDYTGDDILKRTMGEFSIIENSQHEYNSLNDVNTSYTIENGPAGDTGPYSCELQYAQMWDSVTFNMIDVRNGVTVNKVGNECKIAIDSSVITATQGSIDFEIVIRDNYGHEKHRYGYISYGFNQGGNGQGGNQGGNTNGGNQGNGGANAPSIIFGEEVTQSDYNDASAIDIPSFPLFQIEIVNNEIVTEVFEKDAVHITRTEYTDGNQTAQDVLPYQIDTTTKVISVSFNGDFSNPAIQVKFTDELSASELASILANKGLSVQFSSGDKGYILYKREVKDYGGTKYKKGIWFNQSAKEKIVQYAHQLQQSN